MTLCSPLGPLETLEVTPAACRIIRALSATRQCPQQQLQAEGIGLYRVYLGVSIGNYGKDNGNYYSIGGLYWDDGKENGNYYNGLCGDHRVFEFRV